MLSLYSVSPLNLVSSVKPKYKNVNYFIIFELFKHYRTCTDEIDPLADKLNAGDGLVGDLLPSIGGIAVEEELMLKNKTFFINTFKF